MESSMKYRRLSLLIAYISISAATLFSQTDARNYPKLPISKSTISESMKKLKALNHLSIDHKPLDFFNLEPSDVSSPFTLPPFDSLSPLPLPGNVPLPPFCVNPPFAPQHKTPHPPPPPPLFSGPKSPPPPPPLFSGPKSPPHGPPSSEISSPSPSPAPSPHPPKHSQSPPKRSPSPPTFPPPVSYPPPTKPSPPSHKKPKFAVWCVAKPTVPDPIIQEAMDYACGSGADCKQIQPNGLCFQPDTLVSHASYAFNSYWQNTKAGGGTCDFGGTAMLVTVDPSSDKCHFVYK